MVVVVEVFVPRLSHRISLSSHPLARVLCCYHSIHPSIHPSQSLTSIHPRYADWAKRRHFNGPVMGGLRKQTPTAEEQQEAPPPVVSASTAWRAHPPTAEVRAARGVAGRYVPGSGGSGGGNGNNNNSGGSSSSTEWEEPSLDEVEAEFWRIVEVAEEQVEALYGQDIDTATYCSAFPTIRVSQPVVCGCGGGTVRASACADKDRMHAAVLVELTCRWVAASHHTAVMAPTFPHQPTTDHLPPGTLLAWLPLLTAAGAGRAAVCSPGATPRGAATAAVWLGEGAGRHHWRQRLGRPLPLRVYV